MADWRGSRTGRFTFVKVTWPDFMEAEEYGSATGGSVEFSALSDLKANGSLSFDGEQPDPDHMMRIYYEFEDQNGESERVAVATMLVEASKPTVEEHGGNVLTSGKATLSSVLKVLSDVELNVPYTVKAGEQAIAKALSLIADCGLPTNNPDPSAYALSQDYTFQPEDANVLGIVNALLGFAGYSSAWVDAYGVVQITPYVEPTEREAVFRFEAGPDSVIYPEMSSESSWGDTSNVVRLSYTTDEECLVAWCKNVDPSHKASLPSRGWREKTLAETVSELAGETPEERLEALKEMARKKLASNSADVEHATVQCAYLPLATNDAAEVSYGGVDWKGSIVSYRVDLSDDSSSSAKVRRFIRSTLQVETGGEIAWLRA